MHPISTSIRRVQRSWVPLAFAVFLAGVWQPTLGTAWAQIAAEPSLRLTLPSEIYAVEGIETGIYFDNVVLTKTPGTYRFQVDCQLGTVTPRRWALTPTAADLGDHAVTLSVTDSAGKALATAETTLTVLPAQQGSGQRFRLLVVGDSLTHASAYPNEIARQFAAAENPTCQMLGTHRPASAMPGVAHEGYGGWTWQRFVSHYEPEPDGTHRKRSSPFVFLDAEGKPTLNVTRYMEEACDGIPPDVVVFMLGINDCFSADPDSLEATDQRIDQMFSHADRLISAFRHAAPQAKLGICLTTPPNARQAAFEANYKDRYSRWGWKRIQHRLVERQLERFGSDKDQQLFIVPTQLYLDPIDGYPANNGVHPNAMGYQQIGRTIAASLKAVLATDDSVPKGQ